MLVTRCVPGRIGAVGGAAGGRRGRPAAGPVRPSGPGKGRRDVGGSPLAFLHGAGLDGGGDVDRRQVDLGLHRLGRERERVVLEALLLELRLHDLRLGLAREGGLGLDHGRERAGAASGSTGAGLAGVAAASGAVGDRPVLRRGLGAREPPREDAQRSRRSGGPTQPLGVIRLELDLLLGRERGPHRAARCAELAGRPDLSLGIDLELIGGGPPDGDGGHPDDGLVGAQALPLLEDGGLSGEDDPLFVARVPGLDPMRRQVDGVGRAARRAGVGPFLGPDGGRRDQGGQRSAGPPRGRWSRFDLPRLLPRFRLSTGAAGLPWPSP